MTVVSYLIKHPQFCSLSFEPNNGVNIKRELLIVNFQF